MASCSGGHKASNLPYSCEIMAAVPVQFDTGGHLTGDRRRDFKKWAERRFVALLFEAQVDGVTEWYVDVFGSYHVTNGTRNRMYAVRAVDSRKRLIEVEVFPGQGGYSYRARIRFAGIVGFEVAAQRIQVAANQMNDLAKTANQRAGKAAEPEPPAVSLDTIAKLRDGLTELIDFGAAAKSAQAELVRVREEESEVEAAVGGCEADLARLDADLAALTEQADALLAAAMEEIARVEERRRFTCGERDIWAARLQANRTRQAELEAAANEKANRFSADPELSSLLKKLLT